jgi:hypothetical protein
MMIAIFNKKTCKSTRFNTFLLNSIIINIEIIQNHQKWIQQLL